MKKRILGILLGIMMLVGALMPSAAFADSDGGSGNAGTGSCRGNIALFGLDPWYAALDCGGENNEILQSNFQGDNLTKKTIPRIIGVVVKDLLFVAGFLAVGFVMYGGFLMMTSAGNPGSVEKAKKTISGAIIGLVISVLAYAIATAVMKVVTGM